MTANTLSKIGSFKALCRRAFALALTVVFVTACRSLPENSRVDPRYDVPVRFIPQRGPHDCGAAALAMLIRHQGGKPDMDDLERRLVLPALGGTIPALIVSVARQHGFDAVIHTGDPLALHNSLEIGEPAIVLLAPGNESGTGHFVVVTGIARSGDAFRAHDGRHANRWIRRETFHGRWSGAGYLAITLPRTPRSRVLRRSRCGVRRPGAALKGGTRPAQK